MRPPRQLPRSQFVFNASAECGHCGQDVKYGPDGPQHLKENGSGEVDADMDQDHRPHHESDDHDPE